MSPIARSLGWHSRSNVTPYFLQASKTGPKRSTSSSRLTSRTSGMAWPPMLPRQRREQEPVAPAVGRRADEARQRRPCGPAACRGSAARRTHGQQVAWRPLRGSACRRRRARNRDRCAAACCPCRARPCRPRPRSPPRNCSVLALGSSPSAWPCRCAATVKISRPCFLARSTRSLA